MDDELHGLLAPVVAPFGLELVDVELRSTLVRVVVDRPGGVDVDAVAEATRAVSDALDAHDPFPGHRYTLEVSSPGIERPLRTPRHFAGAVGQIVSIRTTHGVEGERRFKGRLASADEDGFVLEGDEISQGQRKFSYDDVERARTVFEFGPDPSRGKKGGPMSGRSPVAADRKAKRKKVSTS